MTSLALSTINNHKAKSISAPSVPWKGILAAGIVCGMMLLIWYVISINEMTKGAYTMKSYDKQLTTLSDENQSLQMNLAKTDELSQVLDQAQAAGFEKASGIKYVEIFENSLAKADAR